MILTIIFFFPQTACSPRDWMAKVYAVQAENEVDKANSLRSRKVPFEKRIEYYSKACGLFFKAYETNPEVFNLSRIEIAADSCWKANRRDEESLFKAFEEDYIKAHPQEFEHGDAGVAMMDMGG